MSVYSVMVAMTYDHCLWLMGSIGRDYCNENAGSQVAEVQATFALQRYR